MSNSVVIKSPAKVDEKLSTSTNKPLSTVSNATPAPAPTVDNATLLTSVETQSKQISEITNTINQLVTSMKANEKKIADERIRNNIYNPKPHEKQPERSLTKEEKEILKNKLELSRLQLESRKVRYGKYTDSRDNVYMTDYKNAGEQQRSVFSSALSLLTGGVVNPVLIKYFRFDRLFAKGFDKTADFISNRFHRNKDDEDDSKGRTRSGSHKQKKTSGRTSTLQSSLKNKELVKVNGKLDTIINILDNTNKNSPTKEKKNKSSLLKDLFGILTSVKFLGALAAIGAGILAWNALSDKINGLIDKILNFFGGDNESGNNPNGNGNTPFVPGLTIPKSNPLKNEIKRLENEIDKLNKDIKNKNKEFEKFKQKIEEDRKNELNKVEEKYKEELEKIKNNQKAKEDALKSKQTQDLENLKNQYNEKQRALEEKYNKIKQQLEEKLNKLEKEINEIKETMKAKPTKEQSKQLKKDLKLKEESRDNIKNRKERLDDAYSEQKANNKKDFKNQKNQVKTDTQKEINENKNNTQEEINKLNNKANDSKNNINKQHDKDLALKQQETTTHNSANQENINKNQNEVNTKRTELANQGKGKGKTIGKGIGVVTGGVNAFATSAAGGEMVADIEVNYNGNLDEYSKDLSKQELKNLDRVKNNILNDVEKDGVIITSLKNIGGIFTSGFDFAYNKSAETLGFKSRVNSTDFFDMRSDLAEGVADGAMLGATTIYNTSGDLTKKAIIIYDKNKKQKANQNSTENNTQQLPSDNNVSKDNISPMVTIKQDAITKELSNQLGLSPYGGHTTIDNHPNYFNINNSKDTHNQGDLANNV